MSNPKQRDIELFIVDIFVSIEKIREYTRPFITPSDFQHSSLHWDASMRQLEIIGEALNKLLQNELFQEFAPSYFRKVVNFRNTIAHGYFGIDIDEVWNIITQHLEPLKKDLSQIVQMAQLDLSDAIFYTLDEYKEQKNTSIIDYLKKLQNR